MFRMTPLLCLLPALLILTAQADGVRTVNSELPAIAAIVNRTGFDGTVLIYDLREDLYLSGHAAQAEQRFIPASTFKIFSSLVALETGVIAGRDSVIAWDGVVRNRTELNRSLDLQTAFRLSAVPHYQHLVRQIGTERMQQFIDAVGYGNQDISGGEDSFWLTGALRISPREQVDFLIRLYRGDLPFSAHVMATVRDMMITEQTGDHVIRAKTGWAVLGEGENTGWWTGWMERDGNVLVFASVLQSNAPGPDFGSARMQVVREVLDLLDSP